MPEITLKNKPVTLSGKEVKVGETAPDFVLQSSALADVSLKDSQGKVRLIATIPSLDTPTCHLETKRFNEEASTLTNAVVLVVSMDLPFGQKRWCGAENASNIQTLSDHRTGKFGEEYGVLIKGGGLDRCHARAIFVVGADDKLRYVEYVKEIADHPDYDAALAAARG